MTREEIIEGVIETFEHCRADIDCNDCPMKELCDEWDRLLEKWSNKYGN